MFGLYKKIAGKLLNKNQSQKPKRMKLKKLSPEKKRALLAKMRGAGGKALKAIESGKIQTGASLVTRYAQGKPVVVKRNLTQQQKQEQGIPDTVQIFGYPVPKTQAIVGGLLLAGGIAYVARKH